MFVPMHETDINPASNNTFPGKGRFLLDGPPRLAGVWKETDPFLEGMSR
ncbi:MAG: hypothetical protein ABI760_23035 [Ferruginibacter sp.]